MKQLFAIGKDRYVTLYSYRKSHKTRGGSIMVTVVATIIAALTVGAGLGFDITQFNQQPTQHGNH
jgi:hypothetical protein